MIIAEFSIVPMTGEDLKPYVDAAIDVVKESGLRYEVDAMATTLEGDIDQIFDVVKKRILPLRKKAQKGFSQKFESMTGLRA